MKINPTTIDNFPPSVHETFAQNQAYHDPELVANGNLIQQHAAKTATSSSFKSILRKWLGLDSTPITWAEIQEPPGYSSQSNRYFGFRLFHSKLSPQKEIEILLNVIAPNCNERDGKTIRAFANELEQKSRLLEEIKSRILQFQKS